MHETDISSLRLIGERLERHDDVYILSCFVITC